jgi:uncharacterized membrane protein
MLEAVAALQLLVLLFSVGVLVVALATLARTSGLRQLQHRVEELEHELHHARRSRRRAVDEEEVYDAIPVEEPEPAVTPHPREAPPKPAPESPGIEGVIGRQVLGWVAVVLMLLAVGFFVKYAFDNEWVGPVGQVCSGAVFGAALCAGGYAMHRRGRRLAGQMLTAAGVTILYLTTFATFGYYHLVPRERASVYLTLLVALSALLAVLYDARAIGCMALAGGLLAPLLLASTPDQYRSLFVYLSVLTAGVLAMSFARRWLFLALAASIGVQALFWGWYNASYHPDKLAAALVFQGVLFGLFLLHDALLPAILRRPARPEQLAGVVLNAFWFALAGGIMLSDEPTAPLAALAIGLAILYAVVTAFTLARSPDDSWLHLATVAVGLAFIAAAIGLRGHAGWIALGWAAEGLALWWFGLRVLALPLRALGGGLLVLALFRYLVADAPWEGRADVWPVLNAGALPGLAVALCLVAAGWLTARLRHLTDLDRLFRAAGSLGGVLLAWLVLSLEVYHFASTRWPDEGGAGEGLQRAQASLSVFWAVYAGAVMAAGFWRKLLPLRVLALGLFGLTTAKLILIDMANLPGIYRVAAFFVLAVVLGGAAYAYQRFEAALRSPVRETADA